MPRRILQYSLIAAPLVLCLAVFSQTQPVEPGNEPAPMPSDRATESFLIYSSLIPLGETAGQGWPHEQWLVNNATVRVVADGQPCAPVPNTADQHAFDTSVNPHNAVHFPEEYEVSGVEILQDFDAHCHERWKLDGGSWSLKEPVRLLTPAEQGEFASTRPEPWGKQKSTPSPEILAKYKGAPAIYSFSGVYFNHNHTVALVYATHWCGGLCGQGFWVGLVLDHGQWKQQQWGTMGWIS